MSEQLGILGIDGLRFLPEIGGVIVGDPTVGYRYLDLCEVIEHTFGIKDKTDPLVLPNSRKVVFPDTENDRDRFLRAAEDPNNFAVYAHRLLGRENLKIHFYRDQRVRPDSELSPGPGALRLVTEKLFVIAEHAMREHIRGEAIGGPNPTDRDYSHKKEQASLLFELAMRSAAYGVSERAEEAGITSASRVSAPEIPMGEIDEAIQNFLEPGVADVEYRMLRDGDIGKVMGWQDPPFEHFFIQIVSRLKDIMVLEDELKPMEVRY